MKCVNSRNPGGPSLTVPMGPAAASRRPSPATCRHPAEWRSRRLVAPLTATVMASVPVERAGVAAAVNTAISDVGPQLAVALLFVAMTQNFYGALARDAPGLDVASAAVRPGVAPLNVPGPRVAEQVRLTAREASTGAFRLAMVVAAFLLLAGAVINGAGLRLPSGAPVVRVASADPMWRRCRHVAPERRGEQRRGES